MPGTSYALESSAAPIYTTVLLVLTLNFSIFTANSGMDELCHLTLSIMYTLWILIYVPEVHVIATMYIPCTTVSSDNVHLVIQVMIIFSPKLYLSPKLNEDNKSLKLLKWVIKIPQLYYEHVIKLCIGRGVRNKWHCAVVVSIHWINNHVLWFESNSEIMHMMWGMASRVSKHTTNAILQNGKLISMA